MKIPTLRNILAISIVFLFIVSSITPMVIGINSKIIEEDEFLEKLTFLFSDDHGSFKLIYYKESFQRDHLENDINDESEELELHVVSLSQISGGPIDSPWPMKCHDLQHTGQSPYSTADNPYIEKWRCYSGDWFEDTPIIDNDGTIYAGAGWDLYAINPNGSLKWKYQTDGLILGSSPAIAEDGTIYVGSWDDFLYAINPDGTRKWKFYAYDTIYSSPAIAEDGTIYIGTMGPDTIGRIIAINPNGTEKWHYNTGYWITSDPAIGDDGTVYIGSQDSYLYALYPNGTLRWSFKTGENIMGPPSIADDGTIYIASWDDYLYALYLNGTKKWKYKIGVGAATNPSIASDGTIYVGHDALYAINPNGTQKWTFSLGSERLIYGSSPAISADGTIYVGTNIGNMAGGEIIAVNPDGTERWRKRVSDNWIDSSPSIAEDGTVYIGSADTIATGYLHAFGPVESNSPPDAPSISGTINGRVGVEYWYGFRAVDPDNNPVTFYIDWGDGTSGWVGTRASGELCYFSHKWTERGTYNISAKVKDVLGEESDWAYLEVTMPKNKVFNFNFNLLEWLFERFPHMFPILRQLIKPYI